MPTHITGNRISLVKNGQYPKKKVGNQLEVLSWNIPNDKTDDGFHEGIILKWFVKIFPEKEPQFNKPKSNGLKMLCF